MSGAADGRTEYALVANLRRYVAVGAVVVAGAVGLAIWQFSDGVDEVDLRFAAPAVLIVAAMGWTLTRNLVLRASLRGGRLRARTALAHHDIAVSAVDEICWRVEEGRIGSVNPLNQVSARVRYGHRTLRLLMPGAAALLRALEIARSPREAGAVREFDFTALIHAPAMGPRTIRYATLNDRVLHAVTGDSREHDVPLDTIEDIDDQRDSGTGDVTVRHRGGELRIALPVGGELADRLLAAKADR